MEKAFQRSQEPVARSQKAVGAGYAPKARTILASGFWLLASVFAVPWGRGQTPAEEPARFLKQYVHLPDDQISLLERGQTVSRLLEPGIPTEIVPFGAVSVRVSGNFLIERYRDIVAFKKSKEVLQIGRMRWPAQVEDLDALTLEQGDVDALKKCQVGDCAVKLPADAIERLRTELNRSSADYSRDATAYFRRFLVDLTKGYISRGNAALPVYGDKKTPVPLAGEFGSILQESACLTEYAPRLADYLRDFPKGRPEGAEEFIYWSKEKFGYKAVLSLTHVTILRVPRPEAEWTFFASKQIYASHYFQGSLGLAMYVEKRGQSGDGTLIYINRSRADLPQGLFSGIIRYFVRRRVLDGMDKYLKVIKDRLETEYRAGAYGK